MKVVRGGRLLQESCINYILFIKRKCVIGQYKYISRHLPQTKRIRRLLSDQVLLINCRIKSTNFISHSHLKLGDNCDFWKILSFVQCFISPNLSTEFIQILMRAYCRTFFILKILRYAVITETQNYETRGMKQRY